MFVAIVLAVSALAASSASALVPPGADGPPIVERRHSVARLLSPQEECDLQIGLAPTWHWLAPSESVDALSATAAPLHGDALLDLVQSCVAPEQWGVDEFSLQLAGDELVVAAPAAVQDQVAAFLARLAQALACRAQLQVRVLSPVPGELADSVSSRGGLRPLADADRALAAAQANGATLVRSATLALRDAVAQRLRAGASRAQVVDFEDEIAHAIAAAVPVTHEVHLGLELIARSARVPGGNLLDIALREVEPTEERTRAIVGRQMLLLADESFDPPAAGTIAETRSAFVSLAGSFLLQDGMALWLPCQVATIDGTASFLLDLRVVGDDRPPSTSFAIAPDPRNAAPRAFLTGSLGSRGQGGIEIEPPPASLFDARELQFDDEPATCMFARFAPAADPDANADALRDAAELGDDDELATWPGRLFARVDRDAADRLATALAARAAVAPPSSLTGTIVDRAGKVLARFATPLLEGRPLALWSGRERLRLADWDVDVACDVNGQNPWIEPAVDGFALRLEAHRAIDGGVDLRVDGKLRFALAAPTPRALGDAERREIDHERARTLVLQETRRFAPGSSTVRLGGSELALELTVTVPATEPLPDDGELRLPIGGLRGLEERDPGAIALLPIVSGPNRLPAAGASDLASGDWAGDGSSTLLDALTLQQIAQSAVARETWLADGVATKIDGDLLVVRAPADVRRQVAARMAQLDARLAPTRELRVRVRSADGKREVATLRAALRDRIAQRLQAGTRETFVGDWEVVICERAAAADPIESELFAGLELVARGEAVAGGTLLALALSASEPAAPTARFEPTAVATMHSDSTLFTRRACGTIDLPRSAFLTLSGELFLADGATATLPCRFAGAGGAFDWILELELAGTKPPLPDRPGQQLLDTTMAFPAPPPEWLFDDRWAEWMDRGRREEGFSAALVARLASGRSSAAPSDLGAADGGGAPPDRLADALAGGLTIDATLLDRQRQVLAAFTVSPLGGRRLVVAHGIEGRRVARWDLDVANDSATVNPDPEAWVDGCIVSLAPARDGAGRMLHVVATVCALDELPRRRELDDGSRCEVEELSARRLHLDQLVALPDEGGTVELGGGDLTLVLRCTPLSRR